MTEGESLLEGLVSAHDDTQRTTLIAAAPKAVREQLKALLAHRTLEAAVDAELAALSKFTLVLKEAADDAARLTIIKARDPTFIAEWYWSKTATVEDAMKRYFTMLKIG